jgi:hypothetical protein
MSLRVPSEGLLLLPDKVVVADSKTAEDDNGYKDARPGRCNVLRLKSTTQVFQKVHCLAPPPPSSHAEDAPLLFPGPAFVLLAAVRLVRPFHCAPSRAAAVCLVYAHLDPDAIARLIEEVTIPHLHHHVRHLIYVQDDDIVILQLLLLSVQTLGKYHKKNVLVGPRLYFLVVPSICSLSRMIHLVSRQDKWV